MSGVKLSLIRNSNSTRIYLTVKNMGLVIFIRKLLHLEQICSKKLVFVPECKINLSTNEPNQPANLFNCIVNPLIGTGNYSATSNVVGTLAVDGWAVTFGTARRGLGEAAARSGPSSLYQMQQPNHQRQCTNHCRHGYGLGSSVGWVGSEIFAYEMGWIGLGLVARN